MKNSGYLCKKLQQQAIKQYPKDSGNFVNRFTSQKRGAHNDLVCQNMISTQVH